MINAQLDGFSQIQPPCVTCIWIIKKGIFQDSRNSLPASQNATLTLTRDYCPDF